MRGEDWADEDIEQLRTLWAKPYLSASVIGRMMGRTRSAVLGKVHRLELPLRGAVRRTPDETRERRRQERARYRQKQVALGLKPAAKPRQRKPKPPPIYVDRNNPWVPLTGSMPTTLEHTKGCMWPVSDPFAPPGSIDLFCNEAKTEGAYCPYHAALSVGQGTPSEQTAVRAARNAVSLERRVAA